MEFIRRLKLTCLLFTFVGDVNEIVRLELTHVTINSPTVQGMITPTRCQTYMKVFSQLERAELNQNDIEAHKICADENKLDQNVFYSSGRVLIIEISLQPGLPTPTVDVRGTYKFEDKEWYQNDGAPVPDSNCDYMFVSPRRETVLSKQTTKSTRSQKEAGQFFSPMFPRNYPKNINCTYFFLGHPQERVVLSLNDVKLSGLEPQVYFVLYQLLMRINILSNFIHFSIRCDITAQNDVITLYDITDTQTNDTAFVDFPFENIPKFNPIDRICSNTMAVQTISQGHGLLLRFVSLRKSHTAGGFRGRFRFIPRNQVTSTKSKSKDSQHSPRVEHINAQSEQSYRHESENVGTKHFWMNKSHLTGLVSSPNYPQVYPTSLQLPHVFHIPPETQLKLRFLDFRLDDRLPNDCTQGGGDRIEIYHGSHLDAKHPNKVLCGKQLNNNQSGEYSVPRDLRVPLHLLTLIFITDAYTSGNERGFLLSYNYESIYPLRNPIGPELNHEQPASFVTHTNGSIVGLPNKMKSTQNGVCHFTITSNGRELFGRIPLPRYMDILPKDAAKMENQSKLSCRWELQGDPGQRIQLKLQRKYASVQSHTSLKDPPTMKTFSSIQHDQELQFDGSAQATPLVSSASPLRILRCQTPLSVELVNYKSSSDIVKSEITDMTERSIPMDSSQPIGAAFRTSTDPHFHQYDPQPSDPVRICAGEVASQSPAGKGFMSGKFPRLDVVLHLDTPQINSPRPDDVIINSGEYVDLGYDIEYKFVTSKSNCLRNPSPRN
ncbi:hypothetical protein PHET_00051 [Paragonimus heterotremus]|uniref:CUB domain-containing protein n=1 Tax=Paragonimus heterotremus TaxID=100268 RepID=A0A8J4X3V4_9TREM|nr:hypothetical protein PHET_00051 [Paragonimus heterotremus]